VKALARVLRCMKKGRMTAAFGRDRSLAQITLAIAWQT
jgi:hypothetical protein